MIKAEFERVGGIFRSVRVSGHAGFAEAGEDIVCAAVSSAFQLTANGITEILAEKADIIAKDNVATLTLSATPTKAAADFLSALHLHLSLLHEQYHDYIEIIISEV